MNHYKVYTGPTVVAYAASRLRSAGLTVTLEGTQDVYVNAEDVYVILDALGHGSGWTWRDVKKV